MNVIKTIAKFLGKYWLTISVTAIIISGAYGYGILREKGNEKERQKDIKIDMVIASDSVQAEMLKTILWNQDEQSWYIIKAQDRLDAIDRSYQAFLRKHDEKDVLLDYVQSLQTEISELKKN